MVPWILSILFLLPVLQFSCGKDLVRITDDNYENVRKDNDFLLLVFVPEMGFSELKHIQKIMSKKNLRSRVGKVDAGNKELIKRFHVNQFPCIKLFRGEEVIEYTGLKYRHDIVNWVERREGPVLLRDRYTAQKMLLSEKSIVVGFFSNPESRDAKVYIQVAVKEEDFPFFLITDKKLMREYYQYDGAVVIMKNFDDEEDQTFDDEFTVDKLTVFVHLASSPLVTEFKDINANRVMSRTEVDAHFLFVSKKKDEEHRQRIVMMKKVAQKYKNQIKFIHVDWVYENSFMLRLILVSEQEMPTFCIYDLRDGARYKYGSNREMSVDSMNEFIKSYYNRTAKKTLLSEPIPDDWDKFPVKTLTNGNFKEVAYQDDKDVFIAFYAPWCGKSRRFSELWDAVGERFSNSTDKIIAKMNAVDNELIGVQVEYFPTLGLVAKESKVLTYYRGSNTMENLIKWVETLGYSYVQPYGDEGESQLEASPRDMDHETLLPKDEL